MASISTRRSGSARAATPIMVMGLVGSMSWAAATRQGALDERAQLLLGEVDHVDGHLGHVGVGGPGAGEGGEQVGVGLLDLAGQVAGRDVATRRPPGPPGPTRRRCGCRWPRRPGRSPAARGSRVG